MNELPSGWAETKLETVADWGSGGTPKAGTASFYGGEIPWAVIGDLTDGVISATQSTITEQGLLNSSAKLVSPDCVLIAMYGSIASSDCQQFNWLPIKRSHLRARVLGYLNANTSSTTFYRSALSCQAQERERLSRISARPF